MTELDGHGNDKGHGDGNDKGHGDGNDKGDGDGDRDGHGNDKGKGDGDGRDWLAQARRGVVELCVLILIGKNPHYGYELAVALSHWKPLAAPEGTLYPMLRRLQRAGMVDASWHETRDGPPRKYYHLTPAGQRLLDAQLAEWEELTRSVAYLRAGIFDPDDIDVVADPPDEEVPHGSGSQRQSAVSRRAAPPSRAPAPR